MHVPGKAQASVATGMSEQLSDRKAVVKIDLRINDSFCLMTFLLPYVTTPCMHSVVPGH